MATEKTASFTVPIKVESNAKEGAADLETLRSRIVGSQQAVKDFGAAMRSLRGKSDEVASARADLKAKIDAERDAISRGTVQLLKQETTFEKLARQQKANSSESKTTAAALKEIGGPAQSVRDKLESLKTVLEGAKTASGATTVALSALAVGAVAAAAVVAALGAAFVVTSAALARFILEGANWNRTAGLMREAASGSAANASALGHQIDALAGRVATSKTELNELGLALTKSLLGSRVSGQGLVDTFNAVAQASAAMGGQAASKLQELIERGKQWGRIGIGIGELQGTGIQFEDVAANLARNLKIGLDDARLQLRLGWTDANAGAKAIRETVEKRFAAINLARMLDLDVLKVKFKDALTSLTSGVDLSPLLKNLQALGDLFTANTVTGAALKELVTDLGTVLVGKAANGADLAKRAIQQFVIWSLELEISLLKGRRTFLDWIKPFSGLLTVRTLVIGAVAAVSSLTVAVLALAVATAPLWGPIALAAAQITALTVAGYALGEWIRDTDWSSLGSDIIDGLVGGITSGWEKLKGAVAGVASKVKETFKSLLGIHSPSVVFREYGQRTTEGYAQGLDSGRPDVRASAEAIAPRPPTSPASSGVGGVAKVDLTLQVNVAPGAGGHDVAKAITAPDVLSQLTKAVEDALTTAGIPIQQTAGA